MTDIRDLLREASGDIEIDAADPVMRVRNELRRRRRSHAAILAVVAAVAAAIIVPVSLHGSSPPVAAIGPGPARNLEHWDSSAGVAASGFGSVWALKCCDVVSGHSWVDQLDPLTGDQLGRIPVPAPTSSIAAGAGYVWVIGANPGGGAPSYITAIDPRTHSYYSMHITDPKAAPYDIAFAGGAAWVTIPLENAVWRLTVDPAAHELRKSVVTVPGGPADIATTAAGELWVQEANANALIEIDPSTAVLRGRAVPWTGHIYGPADGLPHDLLASASSSRPPFENYEAVNLSRVRRSVQDGRACNNCEAWAISATGEIRDAVSTHAGVFVWETVDGGIQRTYFLDNFALHGGLGRTSARLPYGGPLAADSQDLGVVIGNGPGLLHWTPSEIGVHPLDIYQVVDASHPAPTSRSVTVNGDRARIARQPVIQLHPTAARVEQVAGSWAVLLAAPEATDLHAREANPTQAPRPSFVAMVNGRGFRATSIEVDQYDDVALEFFPSKTAAVAAAETLSALVMVTEEITICSTPESITTGSKTDPRFTLPPVKGCPGH
ncbi:MAG TPA: hypothetical protein VHC43_12135 [Mycobacteriales bacterium]|nr:hypothetical protein [Mycobacteriales bacterium]